MFVLIYEEECMKIGVVNRHCKAVVVGDQY